MFDPWVMLLKISTKGIDSIHNRAIKSATVWFEYFTLAFHFDRSSHRKNDLQLR